MKGQTAFCDDHIYLEIPVGHLTNSMALVSDSFHMLSDIAALTIAFLSVRMAPKSWDKNTYGWARAEVLGKFFFLNLISKDSFIKTTHSIRISLVYSVVSLILMLLTTK